MTRKEPEIEAKDEEFLKLLEDGVREVLKARKCTPAERLQAVNAGAKLLAIRHKIGGGDEGGFFDK